MIPLCYLSYTVSPTRWIYDESTRTVDLLSATLVTSYVCVSIYTLGVSMTLSPPPLLFAQCDVKYIVLKNTIRYMQVIYMLEFLCEHTQIPAKVNILTAQKHDYIGQYHIQVLPWLVICRRTFSGLACRVVPQSRSPVHDLDL